MPKKADIMTGDCNNGIYLIAWGLARFMQLGSIPETRAM